MPLTFDFTSIEERAADDIGWIDAGDGNQRVAPVTDALIWHTLNTGIGRITKENAAEVYARIAFVEQLYGPSLRAAIEEGDDDGLPGDFRPRPITPTDVRRHIGLSTNASFKVESRASFLKRHAAYALDQAKAEYEKEAKA